MSQGELPADAPVLAELIEPSPVVEPKPWGFWMTAVFSFVVLFVFVAIETIITIAFIIAQSPRTPITSEYVCSGVLLSVATWAAMPVSLTLVVLFAWARREMSVRDYLSLHRVSIWRFLAWANVLVIFVVVTDGVTWLLGRDVVPKFMIDWYRTAGFVPAMLGSLWIAAPVFEEAFFRGFMFRGIQQSRLGNVGAILITALVWSVIHLQYSAYEVTVIFLAGILLGVARARSNSIYLTIGLHSLMNIIATIELWVYLSLHPSA